MFLSAIIFCLRACERKMELCLTVVSILLSLQINVPYVWRYETEGGPVGLVHGTASLLPAIVGNIIYSRACSTKYSVVCAKVWNVDYCNSAGDVWKCSYAYFSHAIQYCKLVRCTVHLIRSLRLILLRKKCYNQSAANLSIFHSENMRFQDVARRGRMLELFRSRQ